ENVGCGACLEKLFLNIAFRDVARYFGHVNTIAAAQLFRCLGQHGGITPVEHEIATGLGQCRCTTASQSPAGCTYNRRLTTNSQVHCPLLAHVCANLSS